MRVVFVTTGFARFTSAVLFGQHLTFTTAVFIVSSSFWAIHISW